MFGRSLAVFAGTTLMAAAALPLLAGAARVGAAAGVITAALATTLSVVLLSLTAGSSLKKLLSALVAGFFARMLMVAAGLLVAMALDGDLLYFTGAFFLLYLTHQAVEIAVVSRNARAAQLEGKP